MEETPLATVKLNFTTLEFYRDYVVSSLFENQVLDQMYVDTLVKKCLDFYQGQEFVYIGNRVAHYNVDPTVYINLNKNETLVGIAIVCSRASSITMAYFEKTFSKLPFEVFLELEDAQEWAHQLVKK